jgi:hypothetical protein
MAKKKPTIKEVEAKVELLTRINNQACAMIDTIGGMLKIYIQFRGDEPDFRKYYQKEINKIKTELTGGK